MLFPQGVLWPFALCILGAFLLTFAAFVAEPSLEQGVAAAFVAIMGVIVASVLVRPVRQSGAALADHQAFVSGTTVGRPAPQLAAPDAAAPATLAAATAAEGALVAGAVYPSGRWSGYYTQRDREHGVAAFELCFSAAGVVSGSGVDDVGRYSIIGRHGCGSGSYRVAFSKTYAMGSANAAGMFVGRKGGNLGHTVEYRGEPAAWVGGGGGSGGSGGVPSLAHGLRGTWTLTAGGRDRGAWHLWPIMSDWQRQQREPSTGASNTGTGDGWLEEGECCVCMDAGIAAALHPCGHVCLCVACAHRLNPRLCPLCRAPSDRVVVRPQQPNGTLKAPNEKKRD